jgi:hypothetical protein
MNRCACGRFVKAGYERCDRCVLVAYDNVGVNLAPPAAKHRRNTVRSWWHLLVRR